MSVTGPDHATRAAQLVAELASQPDAEMLKEAVESLVTAIAEDLRSADDSAVAAAQAAVAAEERLAKLEEQTHVLAEAVIAITDSTTVAPAVQAVKDKM